MKTDDGMIRSPSFLGVTVHGLEEVTVQNAEDIFRILDRAMKQRQIAETNLNKSSRQVRTNY